MNINCLVPVDSPVDHFRCVKSIISTAFQIFTFYLDTKKKRKKRKKLNTKSTTIVCIAKFRILKSRGLNAVFRLDILKETFFFTKKKRISFKGTVLWKIFDTNHSVIC